MDYLQEVLLFITLLYKHIARRYLSLSEFLLALFGDIISLTFVIGNSIFIQIIFVVYY